MEKVSIPLFGSETIEVPELFAFPTKKGFKLASPVTKSNNLSTRKGLKAIKILKQPIKNSILMEHTNELIPLTHFSKKDIETIESHFNQIAEQEKQKE